MKKNPKKKDRTFKCLWDHANVGAVVAIVLCDDQGDVMKAGKRLLESGLPGWISDQAKGKGIDDYVVAISPDEGAAHEFVKKVAVEAGLSAVVAKGFDIALWETSDTGGARTIFQTPAGCNKKEEDTPEGFKITWTAPEPDSEPPSRSQWAARLEAAYRELRRYMSNRIKWLT